MPKDILLDRDLDLVLDKGDLIPEESTLQHQKILLLTEKGEFKEYPKRGVAARRYLEEHQPDNLAREIRQEFFADGMQVRGIVISENLEINVEASYEN